MPKSSYEPVFYVPLRRAKGNGESRWSSQSRGKTSPSEVPVSLYTGVGSGFVFGP